MTPREIIVQIDKMKRSLDFDETRFSYRVSPEEWDLLEDYLNALQPMTLPIKAKEKVINMVVLGVTILKNYRRSDNTESKPRP